MEVEINGEIQEVADQITVQGLKEQLALTERRVAVEINRELIPQAKHLTTVLNPGDKIEIVTLVGGG